MWLQFIVRRLFSLVLTVVAASVIIFFAVALIPGDPAVLLSGTSRPTPELLEAIRERYQLDEPVFIRYGGWVQGLLSGDLGRSFVFNTEVTALIGPRLGKTIFLILYSAILIVGFGVGSGVLAALRPRSGRVVLFLSSVAMGAPSFVVAILLAWFFGTRLGWFPVFGAGEGGLEMLWYMTLPAISLSLAFLAYVSRITRTAVESELKSEHVQTAFVRGVPTRLVVIRHVLRNAAAPITTVSGITVAGLLAASVVIEQAFALDGIGSLLIASAAAKDLPVVQSVVLGIVIVFAVVTTCVDIVNAALDRRVLVKGGAQ